ncbi:TPA: hypothetical protein ACK3Q6_004480 [Burkholderia cepacia]
MTTSTKTRAIERVNQALTGESLSTYTQLRDALAYMLETCGHLESDYPGDYEFSHERAILEAARPHE